MEWLAIWTLHYDLFILANPAVKRSFIELCKPLYHNKSLIQRRNEILAYQYYYQISTFSHLSIFDSVIPIYFIWTTSLNGIPEKEVIIEF